MTCKACGRAVKNDFRSKLRHAVNYHPEHIARILAPLLENPFQAGVKLAEQLKGYRRQSSDENSIH